MSIETSYYINGDEPQIVGQLCQGFCVTQMQENFEITDPANVAYFKFSDLWFRLYFDGNTIFWRPTEEPSEPVNSTVDSGLFTLNLCEMNGVVGCKLEAISYTSGINTVGVLLKFSQGVNLEFTHNAAKDITSFKC